jgi:hypothetical protein
MQGDGLLDVIRVFWGALCLKRACPPPLSPVTTQASGSTQRLYHEALRQVCFREMTCCYARQNFSKHTLRDEGEPSETPSATEAAQRQPFPVLEQKLSKNKHLAPLSDHMKTGKHAHSLTPDLLT